MKPHCLSNQNQILGLRITGRGKLWCPLVLLYRRAVTCCVVLCCTALHCIVTSVGLCVIGCYRQIAVVSSLLATLSPSSLPPVNVLVVV